MLLGSTTGGWYSVPIQPVLFFGCERGGFSCVHDAVGRPLESEVTGGQKARRGGRNGKLHVQ